MTQVINKIVAPEEGEEYSFKVHSNNIEMPNGMSLTQFYNYVMDFFNEGHFIMFNSEEPQSNQVKFWYKQ